MRPDWESYRAQMLLYLRYWPLAALLAFIPMLFEIPRLAAEGRLLKKAVVCLTYGFFVPASVWVVCGVMFGVLTYVRRGREFEVSLPLSIVGSALGMVLGIWLTLHFKELVYGEPLTADLYPAMLFGLVMLAVFTLLFENLRTRQQAFELRAVAAEASYRALEHQMKPHFLFNALNSLAEMIESESKDSAQVAYTLSDLYRRILANSKDKTSTLASELDIVSRYLDIEKIRFGQRLAWTADVPPDASELHVPSLVVQTLVENAVKHGIAPSVDGGRIDIVIDDPGEGLRKLSIINTGAPLRAGMNGGTGIPNTRARLDLLYSDRHDFSIESDEQGRTVASFFFTGVRID